MTRETHLLDAIEDAERNLAHARMVRRCWRACTGVLAVVVAALIIAGIEGNGPEDPALFFLALVILPLGGVGLILWSVDGDVHTDVAFHEHQLRKARRAHRDHLLGADL